MYPCFKHKFCQSFILMLTATIIKNLKYINLSKGLLHLLLSENLPGPTTGNNSSEQFSGIPCKWSRSLYFVSGIFRSAQLFVSCLIRI